MLINRKEHNNNRIDFMAAERQNTGCESSRLSQTLTDSQMDACSYHIPQNCDVRSRYYRSNISMPYTTRAFFFWFRAMQYFFIFRFGLLITALLAVFSLWHVPVADASVKGTRNMINEYLRTNPNKKVIILVTDMGEGSPALSALCL